MAKNTNLHAAKSGKNDEFYTHLSDIEKEMKHYKDFFRGKKVFCNCNDDRWSSFFKFFSMNFEHLGLAKLTCISYSKEGHGMKYVFEGDVNKNRMVDDEEITITELNGHGDFRDDECRALLTEADVVVTNPPFSLFREFIALMMEFNKKFLVIGNMNAVTCKEVFPYIKNNQMWYGPSISSGDRMFRVPDEYELKAASCGIDLNGNKFIRVKGIRWFTNIEHSKRHLPLDLYKRYNPTEYPKYDNYDAIECGKTCDIPMDYDGVIGVPITFLDKYCPDQFEIVDARSIAINDKQKNKNTYLIKDADGAINGKPTYARICIRHKK